METPLKVTNMTMWCNVDGCRARYTQMRSYAHTYMVFTT